MKKENVYQVTKDGKSSVLKNANEDDKRKNKKPSIVDNVSDGDVNTIQPHDKMSKTGVQEKANEDDSRQRDATIEQNDKVTNVQDLLSVFLCEKESEASCTKQVVLASRERDAAKQELKKANLFTSFQQQSMRNFNQS